MPLKFVGLVFFIVIINQNSVASEVIEKYLTNPQVIGEARFSILLWKIYDVTLHSSSGEWPTKNPYSLTFRYLRDVSGKELTSRSISEIRKQGQQDENTLTKWEMSMQTIFPDVKKGSVLTAVFVPGNHTVFAAFNQEIGNIKGDSFLNAFAGIWLSEKTSLPELRQKLIGSL